MSLPQDFMTDDLPATTLPIYPGVGRAHSVLDCTLWGLVICYIIKVLKFSLLLLRS